MKLNFVDAKSIITKSNIPSVDYVINPYTGCTHSCIYCYAEFMKRFTGHGGEDWGSFLDVKHYDWNKIKPEKYNDKRILFSSVTDPYIPLEMKYKSTRTILEHLIGTSADISILTKSKFVTRDIDLFNQFENIEVGISISNMDENLSRKLEPFASKPLDRLEALRKIHENGIPTYVFVSPVFPKITNIEKIIDYSIDFADRFSFENFNYRPHNVPRIYQFIEDNRSMLIGYYKELRNNPSLWDKIENEIIYYCELKKVPYQIAFHHGGFSKKKEKKE
jgi:DNA repair photolyase